ncbi:MAG: DUF3618 domain-containing protein [Propionibacteriaceae bacterium]|nr:DUF3618 domain-containing protein [Propionibacteriaceae bacterium]
MADERTPDDIERDLALVRQRLADNISELITEVHPRVVVHRTVEETKRQANQLLEDGIRRVRKTYGQVKRIFKDEAGWRVTPVAIAGAATVVFVAAIVLAKKK